MADLLIGVDAGTSVIKAVAFDMDGRQVAVSAEENRIVHVDDGGVEQDLDETWRATASVLGRLAAGVGAAGHRVAAIAVTGQGDGTWLIDRDHRPVAPALLWLDARAGGIVSALRAGAAGPAVYRITGTGLNPSLQSGQLLWLKRHRPQAVGGAATAFHCKDWLYLNLTGERATDLSEGCFTFGSYRERVYAEEVLRLLELQDVAPLLPPMIDGTHRHGTLAAAVAGAVGLPQGTPVVLAPLDVVCTGIGAGVYEPEADVGCTILGSTGAHLRLYHRVEDVRLADQTGYTIVFPAPDTWMGFMSNMACTLNIDWLVACAGELLDAAGGGMARPDLLRLIDRRAGEAEPGRLLYHPYIYEIGERGPFVEPRARAQVLGLTARTGFFDLARAVYEGLGFAARDCYAAMGPPPAEIRVTGGAARSDLCRRILAAAVGTPVRCVLREEAGAAGAAIVAAAGLGHFSGVGEACDRWVQPHLGDLEAPETELAAIYDRLFTAYRLGYRQMFPLWEELDRVRQGAPDARP